MFAVAGTTLEDDPVEIERRFSVVAAELSRLVGRIRLADKWQHAAANKTNGHGQRNEQPQETNPDQSAVTQVEPAGACVKTAEENAPVRSGVDSGREIALR
jgi:hypothetical protein